MKLLALFVCFLAESLPLSAVEFGPLRVLPKLIPEQLPKKRNKPIVDQYKQQFLATLDSSIKRLEDQIQRLRSMNAPEAEIKECQETLERWKRVRREVASPSP